MNPRTKVIYRLYNVDFMESHKYFEIYNLEDTTGYCIFKGDEFSYEQKDVNSNILNHNYAMRIMSSNNGEKLRKNRLVK